MGRSGLWSALAVAAASLVAVGCGGHGRGFRVASDPITITSNALPTTLSGEVVNFCLPFSGGSGGPYLLEVIDGSLPPGVEPDSDTVCLVGRVLEDGVYDFKLKLTDTGSDPFTTSIQTFHWVINVGPLVFATDASLPVMVFAQFQSIPLVVAGGVPPYSCQVVDELGNPNDEPLPTGLTIPADSCTIVGAPIGVKPASPFVYKVTVEARDHADDLLYPTPATVRKEFTITVLVPPVVITSTTVADGKCGTVYGDSISISDGIPPFTHELVTADVPNSLTRLKGDTDSIGGIAKSNVDARAYPLDATAGPYSGKFPEGVYLDDASGALAGIPRRSGAFNAWVYHVQSKALPANPTQNAWKSFSFTMQNGTPPAIALDNSVLLAGNAFSTASNFLLDPDAGKAYSKQFLATSGVPNDGFSDAPHKSERVALPLTTEVPGQYSWSSSIVGVPSLASLQMEFTLGGVLRGQNPGNVVGQTRTAFLTLTVTALDRQLPTANSTSGTCRFAVGPDRVVISESTALHTATAVNATFAPLGTFNHVSFEYNDQSIYMWEPFASGMTVRTLSTADNTHSSVAGLPGTVTLSTVLTSIDHMPVTVNPTWWAYDAYNLNALGARALQHADLQRTWLGEGYNADSSSTTSMSVNNAGLDTAERNGDACIELPAATSVVHDPSSGVYNNGGQLRAFDGTGTGGNTYFGFYVVRKDGKIYVPFAIDRVASGFEGFGDAVLTSNRAASSVYRRLQITVSPDGRIGAVKMKKDVDNFVETIAAGEEIVLFSLTGEALWSGQTWRRVSVPTTPGTYMYGTSMALTNNALYYLTGDFVGTSSTDAFVVWRSHYAWRLDALSAVASPALLAPSFGGTGNWTNSSGNPLSTTFHRWAPPGATGLNSNTTAWTPSPALASYAGSNFLTTGGSPSKSDLGGLSYSWGNFAENSSAPIPFRVSRNGRAVAIVAADGVTASGAHLAGVNFMSRSVYVDYYDSVGGTWNFREAATARRRFAGGTRLSGCRGGEHVSKSYSYYQGPATQLEISDDGTIVAAVYNASVSSWTDSASSGGASNFGSSANSYELVSVMSAAGASSSDPWATRSENLITSTTFTLTNTQWRFGSLAFTRNATSMPGSTAAGALMFWGGLSWYVAGSYGFSSGYCQASHLTGTIFQWNPNGGSWASTGQLQSILATTEGGTGVNTYSSGTPNTPSLTNYDPGGRGAIMPVASFYSNDGRFYYIESMSPLTNGVTSSGTATTSPNDATRGRLIGVQVLDTTTTITSTPGNKLPLRAFAVAPWPTDPGSRGFGPNYGTSSSWNPNQAFSFCGGNSNHRVQTAVTGQGTSGNVFFTGYLQNNTWANTSDGTTSFSGGGPTNNVSWSDGSQYAGDVLVFSANVGGGVTNLTNLGGTSPSTSRMIHYLQPNATSTKIAFQTTASTTTSFAFTMSDREQVRAVTNINFSATGSLTTTPSVFLLESVGGRAGPSMTWDALDTRLYYAFGSASGNENAMVLKEATFNSTGTAVSGTRTQPTGVAGTAARFAVLHSGR
ncbi:MAG: hypothetical protein IT460_09150 [Planctomycetes bacterium]|nr:hypothetical protein [Planctomycetota bacterium]